jgi:hypothetical protein
MLRFASEQRSDQPLGLPGLSALGARSRLAQNGLGLGGFCVAGLFGEVITTGAIRATKD